MSSRKSSSSSGKRKESQPEHDPYYGYKDIALLSEFVIQNLFSSNDNSRQSSPTNHLGGHCSPSSSSSCSNDSKESSPRLAEFVAYSLYRTQLPDSILFTALFLLRRLKSLYPHAKGTSTSPHRLFLSSLMLSAKITQDDTFSNKSWTIVATGGGMNWDLGEINQMERELFGFLKWDVIVRDEELSDWEEGCKLAWEEEQGLYQDDEKHSEMVQGGDDMDWDILWKKIDRRLNGVDGNSSVAQRPSTKPFRTNSSSTCSSYLSPPESPSFGGDMSSESSNSPFSPGTPLTPESKMGSFEAKRFSINEKSRPFHGRLSSISNRMAY